MTNGEIFETAVRLAGETTASESPDYTDRSESLLAFIIRSLAPLDREIRIAYGLDEPEDELPDSADPQELFPLTDLLIPAASFQLAALLTIDENASLSKEMCDRSEQEISNVRARLPMKPGPTRNVYPGIL